VVVASCASCVVWCGQVGAHEVPVLLREAALLSGLDWDLSLRQVVPYIDGVKYAKHIAMEAEVRACCCQPSQASPMLS
jgi:hypothetical protein